MGVVTSLLGRIGAPFVALAQSRKFWISAVGVGTCVMTGGATCAVDALKFFGTLLIGGIALEDAAKKFGGK